MKLSCQEQTQISYLFVALIRKSERFDSLFDIAIEEVRENASFREFLLNLKNNLRKTWISINNKNDEDKKKSLLILANNLKSDENDEAEIYIGKVISAALNN